MPHDLALSIDLPSPDATAELAAQLAPHLHAGDVLLLEGPIGAGKTHFARALIQSLLPIPEDVPSPTFTLVQVYDGSSATIWHSDLYRLTHPDEVTELGLTDAFDDAICLVEWPDRLGDMAPASALHLCFDPGTQDDTRRLTLRWSDPRWSDMMKDLAP